MPFTMNRRRWLTAMGAFAAEPFLSHNWAEEPLKVPGILDRLSSDVANAPLRMKFEGTTAEECRKWQTAFGAKLRELLGNPKPPEKWKTIIVSTKEFDDHRRDELILQADGVPLLPVYLLLPRPLRKKRVAGVIALHGHGAHGHHPIAGRDDLPGVENAIKNANYDYGRQLVKQGYAVACPCFTPFGARAGKAESFGKQDPCGDTFIRMQILGKLLIAENLRDALWSVQLLAKHDEVDAERLACVGLSYGGRMAMMTAAIEPRIKAAVISGALNAMQERVSKPYSCGAQIIPGLLNFGDVPEIASLIAPRHCMWETGNRDGLIIPKWADEAWTRMQRAYTALGAKAHLQRDTFDGGHVWHGTEAYPMLQKVLATG